MYEEERDILDLSLICWKYFEQIKSTQYASNFSFLLSQHNQIVKEGIKIVAPDIVNGWFRFEVGTNLVTLSLSKEAIGHYLGTIQEFSAFGAAVKMLGAYENYVLEAVESATQKIPDKTKAFREKYSLNRSKKIISPRVGRGTHFFQEVFELTLRPEYKDFLMFFFELRNIAVHNSSIVDERLLKTLESEYVNINGVNLGKPAYWNIETSLLLQTILLNLISEIDIQISDVLEWETREGKAYWYHH